jgi:hypothetical protein
VAIFQMILFLMAGPMHSRLAKQLKTPPTAASTGARSTPITAFQTLAAPWSAPSMPSEAGVVKQRGRRYVQYGPLLGQYRLAGTDKGLQFGMGRSRHVHFLLALGA